MMRCAAARKRALIPRGGILQRQQQASHDACRTARQAGSSLGNICQVPDTTAFSTG